MLFNPYGTPDCFPWFSVPALTSLAQPWHNLESTRVLNDLHSIFNLLDLFAFSAFTCGEPSRKSGYF